MPSSSSREHLHERDQACGRQHAEENEAGLVIGMHTRGRLVLCPSLQARAAARAAHGSGGVEQVASVLSASLATTDCGGRPCALWQFRSCVFLLSFCNVFALTPRN